MRFAIGLGLSVLLHAALVLPWLVRARPEAPPPSREQLVVDLLGLVSNRQVEQQQVARPAEPPPPTPQPKPVARKETRERAPVPRQVAPSPVQVARVEEPVRAAPEPPTQTPVAAQPPVANAAEEDRMQQTVRARDDGADALRKYLAGLRKAIQGKLVYPAEAREAGYVGAPTIRFTLTEEGNILSGSLAVAKSSGYPVLDESAMRAAQAGAPFEKPPRRMEVAIAIGFVQERQ
ncbi:TonB family protein [Variovorax sp.]|jgi:periplasmic protein TonB|uniref:TonB family protein n=1 Tax=Variovorax sp. TaxID=1871043 RepID=UPI0012258E1B|nr:TonB family protein [Variovorax sp.]TAJ61355.1 MAG: energy transducer TonB [Variovorax sp.]